MPKPSSIATWLSDKHRTACTKQLCVCACNMAVQGDEITKILIQKDGFSILGQFDKRGC